MAKIMDKKVYKIIYTNEYIVNLKMIKNVMYLVIEYSMF